MTGEVEMDGGASFLHCSVNGVKSRPKLVILDNTVHLFSTVCPHHYCAPRKHKLSDISTFPGIIFLLMVDTVCHLSTWFHSD